MSDDNGAGASGPKLNVHADAAAPASSPAAEMIAAAQKSDTIHVSDGRTLHVRKPGHLAQYQLVAALGPELGMNTAFVQMCQPLLWLSGITGAAGHAPVAMPQNELQVYGLISELGEAGMDELLVWYNVHVMMPMMDAMDAAKRAAADKAALKN